MDAIELPGVRVTVMRSRGKRGERAYWRARTTDAHRRTIWTGWATRGEATQAVALVLSKGPVRAAVRVQNVADLMAAWVEHQEHRAEAGQVAPKTIANYTTWARHWVGSGVADILTRALTRTHVEDQLAVWATEGVSARHRKNIAAALRMAFTWGAPRGHCPPLDLRRLEGTKVRKGEFVNCGYTPSVDEVLAVLRQLRPGKNRDLLTIMWLTGARAGEISALQVGDWCRADGDLVLMGADEDRGTVGKTEPRRFPVDPDLAHELGRIAGDRGPEERLILGLQAEAHTGANNQLASACAALGIERFTTHGLRRRMVMDMLEDSDAAFVSKVTGHSVTVLRENYVRPTRARLHEAVRRVRARRRRGKVIPLGMDRDG